jgi:hypothetical protein
MRPVENGFVIRYTCCYYVGRGTYDRTAKYATEEEVYKASEASKAVARLVELFKASGEEMEEAEQE